MIDRRGPEWDCTVKEWMLWQWQATMHLNGKGYKATLEGENRDDATSSDATVRDEYVRKNGDLFREMVSISHKSQRIVGSIIGRTDEISVSCICCGVLLC